VATNTQLNYGVGNNTGGLLNYTQPTGIQPLPSLGTLQTSGTQAATVQGQMTNLMQNDNPLMQRAQTRASQAANKRGLLNSSMGVQAGQEAALSAALPIAQADAQAYQTQGLANQNAMNTFGTASQAQGFKKDLANQTYQQQTGTGIYGTPPAGATEAEKQAFIGGGGLITSQGSDQRLTTAQQQAADTARAKAAYEQQVGTGVYSATGDTTDPNRVGGGGILQTQADIATTARDQVYNQTLGTGEYANAIIDPTTGEVTTAAGTVGGGGTITAKNDALLKTQDDVQLHETAMKGLDESMRGNLLTLESNFNSLAQTSRSASTIYSSFLAALVTIQQDSSLSDTDKTTVIDQVWGKAEDSIEVLLAFDSAALGVQQQVSDLQYNAPAPVGA